MARFPTEPHLRGHHNIYYDQLLLANRGSPLWHPGPDMNLPKEYRRKGVSLGDVGILYSESFSFLFNVFLPADHPINLGRVPSGFKPLDISHILFSLGKRPVFKPMEFLTSVSVQPFASRDVQSGYV